MKTLTPKKKVNKRILFVLLNIVVIAFAVIAAIVWADNYEIEYTPPRFDIATPKLSVNKRQILPPVIQVTFDYPVTVDTPIKEYVCKLFDERCKEALAIVQCESGWNNEALGANPNQPWKYRADAGLFQINSVHWDRFGGLTTLLDPYANADAAKELFDESGWGPWYSHGTLCYKENLR